MNVVAVTIELPNAATYTCHVVGLECPTRLLAKRAFEAGMRWSEEHPGAGVGVVRTKRDPTGEGYTGLEDLGSDDALAVMCADADTLAQLVTAIKRAAPVVERRPTESFARACVLRRVDRAIARGEPVLDVIRRHDDHGARLDPHGRLHEQ